MSDTYSDVFKFRGCKWCNGRGCLQCQREADAAYARQFPNGPQPIATFKIPAELDKAKEVIGLDAIMHAFSPGGGGVQEIEDNFRRVSVQSGERTE